jgi:SAM-dependent methyltransferase
VTEAGALRAELAGRIMGFMVSQCVYAAAKLGIADLLAGGSRRVEELADAAGVPADTLYRLLRTLAAYGIFAEGQERTFANSELSELLRDGPGSFREFAVVFGELIFPAWAEPMRTFETGEPSFPRVFGARWEEHLEAQPELSTLFNRFMGRGKEPLGQALAERDWRGDETIVDVGGGTGAVLIALLQRRGDLRGVVFDLPHVVPEAEEQIRSAGLSDRLEAVAGSFADGVPANAEAYVLSHILHGLDDDAAAALLGTIRQAMAEDGRVLIVDGVVAGPNEPGSKLMDLLMLVLSGGRERTEDEWRELLAGGDFELRELRALPTGATLIEAVPS